MTQSPTCPDCGHPQIQLALFDPDLSWFCEACDAESLGEVDRHYPSSEKHQEFDRWETARSLKNQEHSGF